MPSIASKITRFSFERLPMYDYLIGILFSLVEEAMAPADGQLVSDQEWTAKVDDARAKFQVLKRLSSGVNQVMYLCINSL